MSDEAATFTGACVCGNVTYEASGPGIAFQYCHCSRCRRKTGSAHAANLFVEVDNLQFTKGEDKVRRFELPDAKYWSTCFCERCGSALPWKTRTGKAWVVPAGGIDGDPGERPNRNIFFASRASWYVPASELDTHDEIPRR